MLFIHCATLLGLPGSTEGAQDISGKCSGALRRYLLCNALSGLFSVCHSEELFETSAQLRGLLGCQNDTSRCTEKCLQDVSLVTNQSVHEPCSADYQAMHGFSAPLNIFTIGQIDKATNATKARMIPLPNIKTMGGPTLLSYGEPGHCAEIPTAQYCVLSGQIWLAGKRPTTFALGTCLPNDCSTTELISFVHGGGGSNASNLTVRCSSGVDVCIPRSMGRVTYTFVWASGHSAQSRHWAEAQRVWGNPFRMSVAPPYILPLLRTGGRASPVVSGRQPTPSFVATQPWMPRRRVGDTPLLWRRRHRRHVA